MQELDFTQQEGGFRRPEWRFDNMDRWKSRGGKSQRREEKKREDQRRERARRKKRQVREKVETSGITVFFQWIVDKYQRKMGLTQIGISPMITITEA